MLRTILRPVFAAVTALLMTQNEGCSNPPKVADIPLEEAYQVELLRCVHNSDSKKAECYCRKMADVKYGVCDDPAWQPIGRCQTDCEAQ